MVINGVSSRKVERVLHELGVERMSKSQVSLLCVQLDGTVRAFRERRLEAAYPYLMFDAIYVKMREDGRVGNQAVVIAYAVNEHGLREVIGVDIVLTESRESWSTFMRGLIERGLHGVRLVVSDAHEGLKAAIATILPQAQWQRCRVHFLRNIMAHVPQHRKLEIAAAFRSILSMETADAARLQAVKIIDQHSKANPKAMEILGAGLEDVLSFFDFPLRAPPQALVFQSDRAPQRNATQAHQRRGDLPQRRRRTSPDLNGPHRADGGLDNGALLHERGIDCSLSTRPRTRILGARNRITLAQTTHESGRAPQSSPRYSETAD